MNQPRLDITDPRDVACLVNLFDDRIRDDDILGPTFDDIVHVDWATHLPRISIDASSLRDHKELTAAADHNRSEAIE